MISDSLVAGITPHLLYRTLQPIYYRQTKSEEQSFLAANFLGSSFRGHQLHSSMLVMILSCYLIVKVEFINQKLTPYAQRVSDPTMETASQGPQTRAQI
jgi:hypothetical protein